MRVRRLKIGSSTGPVVLESGRPSITDTGVRMPRPRPRKRARSVSYWTPPDHVLVHRHDVRGPDHRLLGRSRAAGRQQGVQPGIGFRLHEKVREHGMRRIRRRRREHDLGVGGELDLAGPSTQVRERSPGAPRRRPRATPPPRASSRSRRRAVGSRRGPRRRWPRTSPPRPRSAGGPPTRPRRCPNRAGRRTDRTRRG